MAVAFFDLDGTLIAGASSERRFVAHLALRGTLGSRQLASALGFVLRHWSAYGRHVVKKDKAYLAGLPVAEVTAIAEAFAHHHLEDRLRASLWERLSQHRQRGEPVAMISGAPDFLVEPLAARLGCDAWRATRFAVEDGRFLAAPPLDHPFAEEKLRHAQEICAQFGARLSACSAYADSVYDLALLEKVGHAVAVSPDSGLARAARDAGWEILAAERSRPLAARMTWRHSP